MIFVNGMLKKDTLDSAAYTCILVSYQRLSPQFQFSLSDVTLVYLSQWSCSYTTWNKTASLWDVTRVVTEVDFLTTA
jgi:hypothetical protein